FLFVTLILPRPGRDPRVTPLYSARPEGGCMQRRSAASLATVPIVFLLSGAAAAQEAPSQPQETAPPKAQEAPAPPKAPEGSIIITLNSTEVAPEGTLGILFTHRFSSPVQGSDIHSLFSFDSGADIGIGLQYVPVSNLEVAVLRNKSLEDYEFSAKYRLPVMAGGGLTAALRGGADYHGQSTLSDHVSWFGQAILGVTLFSRVRVSAMPTYVSDTAGQITGILVPADHDVFNVPLAFSAAITSSFNVHGEYVPR